MFRAARRSVNDKGACSAMKQIILTRLFHWKKQWPSLLFWLSFPIFATFLSITIANQMQSEITVPVGIVMEEETPLARELYEKISQAPFLRIQKTSKTEALHLLEQHKLDSVFIIQKGYENKILSGGRNELITSYQSNLSFAYTPVKEMIVSFVQEDTNRAKAAYTVQQLSNQYAGQENWPIEEIMVTSKNIHSQENLLETDFSFAKIKSSADQNNLALINVWELWSVFALLSTLLLSEWLIKEKNANMQIRLAFTRFTFKNYLLRNLLLYTFLFFIFDLVALGLFSFFFKEHWIAPTLFAMLSFRLMIQFGSFLIALPFKNLYRFYSTSLAITIVFAIISGVAAPVKNISWLKLLQPHHFTLWLIPISVLFVLWYVRKEKSIA